MVTLANVNMRTAPRRTASVRARPREGSRGVLLVYESVAGEDWARVRIGRSTGWVLDEYLDLCAAVDQGEPTEATAPATPALPPSVAPDPPTATPAESALADRIRLRIAGLEPIVRPAYGDVVWASVLMLVRASSFPAYVAAQTRVQCDSWANGVSALTVRANFVATLSSLALSPPDRMALAVMYSAAEAEALVSICPSYARWVALTGGTAATAGSASPSGCTTESSVDVVIDSGEYVTLFDGSIWDTSSSSFRVALWLPGDRIQRCLAELLHVRTGERVYASQVLCGVPRRFVAAANDRVLLDDGSTWRVTVRGYRTSLWLRGHRVVSCGSRLINLNRGESVSAYRSVS